MATFALSRFDSMYNRMQQIKRDIFAMRNGIVAETLHRAGSPYRFIMGVNIPQLKEIAARYSGDAELTALLRADSDSRESQLIAPMICPGGSVSQADARQWLGSSRSREATDVICHSLLRHEDYAVDLAAECLAAESDDTLAYAGIRLLWNLVNSDPATVREMAVAELSKDRQATQAEAQRLIEEADFLLSR